MRRHLLFYLFMATLPWCLSYGYNVPTTVQKKGMLLEEFTGIHCGWCPKGHKIANALYRAHPDNMFVVAVHAGYYAEPGSDEPDFRTTEGTTINGTFGVESYPCGTVNRHAFDQNPSIIIDRGYWTKYSKEIYSQDAPVNLFMTSDYDGATRTLKIHVEGYFTADNQVADQELNVLWTQDNIQGPQNGGAVGDEYIHQHMLRGYITSVWGDTLKTPTKGNYFEKDYTYQLPEAVNKVTVKPEDIRIIAFVTNGKEEVLNVTGTKPVYANYEKALGAVLSAPKIAVGARYGYNFFEANLKNTSDKAIKTATFDVTVNGTSTEEKWEGNISSFATGSITIPASYTYKESGTTPYSITLKSINGEAVASSSLSGEFSKPNDCTPTILVKLQTDYYADENHYFIKDADGKVVKEFGPYATNSKEIYDETATLEANKTYCLEVTDEWGDGIYQPKGYIISHTDGNSLVDQIYDIPDFGVRSFFTTNLKPSGLQTNEAVALFAYNASTKTVSLLNGAANAQFTVYSVAGSKLMQVNGTSISLATLPQGAYLLNIQQNGKNKMEKISIY